VVCNTGGKYPEGRMHDNPYQAPQTLPQPKPPARLPGRRPNAKELLFLGFLLTVTAIGTFLRQSTSARDVSALLVLLLSGACCIALAALVHFLPRH
jgi:hypothetical protein